MSEIEDVFDFLVEYSKMHFVTEEHIMKQHNYPILDLHEVQRQYFILEANKLKFDLKTKDLTNEILQKTHGLLIEWVKSHISCTDKRIKDCLPK